MDVVSIHQKLLRKGIDMTKKKEVVVQVKDLVSLIELKATRNVLKVVEDTMSQFNDSVVTSDEHRMFSMELTTAAMRLNKFLDIFEAEIIKSSKKRTKK